MELLSLVLHTEIAAGRSCVVEANFRRLDRIAAVQVFCTGTPEELAARYRARDRHPGHLDDGRLPDPSDYAPLPLDGPLLEFSVGRRSVDDLVAAVRAALAG